MPVILNSQADIDLWLDPDTRFTDEVAKLMRPLETGLKWHPVSSFVSKVGHDTPECIQPYTEKTISSFFKPTAAPQSEDAKPNPAPDSTSPSKRKRTPPPPEDDAPSPHEPCPICGTLVERSELESHVQAELAESDNPHPPPETGAPTDDGGTQEPPPKKINT
ncbi:hypothetical protein HK104_002202, partial [Borealophlyctis nickersoniae]